MNEYAIAFTSFYRAVYAQEKLQENKIRSTLKKIPPNVLRSCGYAIYLRTNSINEALDVLERTEIIARGVYRIDYESGMPKYIQID
jgi:hypothetical protein